MTFCELWFIYYAYLFKPELLKFVSWSEMLILWLLFLLLDLLDLTLIHGGPPRITQPKDKNTSLERMEFPSQVQVLGFS